MIRRIFLSCALLWTVLIGVPFCPGAELSAENRERAARIAGAMDDRLLAAQVILTGIDGNGVLEKGMQSLLRDIKPGGIMLFKYNLNGGKESIPPFLKTVSDLASPWVILNDDSEPDIRVPPFIAVDHEGGSVHRFGAGVERLPPPLSYWELGQRNGREYALKAIEESAARSGEELHSLGITLNLAPVAEFLNQENAAFLDDRSYGPDPGFVEAAAAAFIRGMSSAGIACVAKHFPGNTGTDPHSAPAFLREDRAALDYRVRPFAGIILSERPSGIMVSHAMVSAWDGGINASRSPVVIRTWLREGLGFQGIVLADDFSMGAITATGLSSDAAVVEALSAGVDMVMTWPRNLAQTHRAILKALAEGRLSRERLREAAARIIFEKMRYGLT
jgi:beta-N-acetylhexosaminidase